MKLRKRKKERKEKERKENKIKEKKRKERKKRRVLARGMKDFHQHPPSNSGRARTGTQF